MGVGLVPANGAAFSPTHFEQLSGMLRRTALPSELPGAPCGVELATPVGPTNAACAPIETSSSTETDAPLDLEVEEVVPMPSGYIALAQVGGLGREAAVRVYGNGSVGVTALDGETVWFRSDASFVQQSGRPLSQPDPIIAPFVLLGRDPVDPFTRAGEHPLATGDLNADGVDDVAVAHWLHWINFEADLELPYYYESTSTVTVLDGLSGEVLWRQGYPGFVPELLIADRTLIVANETGDLEPAQGYEGRDGTRSSLDAWRFSGSGSDVSAAPSWSHSTERSWARWLVLEPAGPATLVAAWTDTPVGSQAATRARVLAIAVDDGSTSWTVESTGYPRFARYDPSRQEVVVLEQDDPAQRYAYAVVARSAAGGEIRRTASRSDAVALTFDAGDVTGEGLWEWVVGDLSLQACVASGTCVSTPVFREGRVAAIDATGGAVLWQQSRSGGGSSPLAAGVPLPQPYDLQIQRAGSLPHVVVSSFMPQPDDVELQALRGPSGTVAWTRRAPALVFPLFVAEAEVDGRPIVLGASSRWGVYGANVQLAVNDLTVDPVHPDAPYQVISAFAVDDGASVVRVPVLGDLRAVLAADVDRDGTTDLVVGGESGAVFALDGARLGENPGVLWTRPVSGPVHEMHLADLDGVGRREVVVAASSGVSVLDLESGASRYEIPTPGEFVWTVSAGDLDHDGRDDLVVPGSSLTAYRGSSGALMWRHAPGPGRAVFGSSAVVDGVVVSQYLLRPPPETIASDTLTGDERRAAVTGTNQNAVAIDGESGGLLWTRTRAGRGVIPQFYRGVVAAIGLAGADGIGAAFTADDEEGPQTDVYSIETGDLLVSATPSAYSSNFGTRGLAGELQQVAFGSSVKIGAGRTVENLSNDYATDVVRFRFDGTPYVVVTRWGSNLELFTLGEFDEADASPFLFFHRPYLADEVIAEDLDGDGSDELITYAFDWDAFAGSQQPGGRFSYAWTIQPRALSVIGVKEAG